MNGGNDLSIALGAIVTIVTGFGVIAKIMLNQASKDRVADRDERKEFILAIKGMSKGMEKVAQSSDKVANATERSANEAKQRNGHLAELVAKTAEKTVEAVQTIGKQNITEQHIEHQVISKHEEAKE